MIDAIMKIKFNPASDANNGLIPVIVQDNSTLQVLMLGYMNKEALAATLASRKVTFFSRQKQRLWLKGESSKNYLLLEDIFVDCDNDSLLIMATPCGPTCHKGTVSCFSAQTLPALSQIGYLNKVIQERRANPQASSYTNYLIEQGLNKIAQKVGEEAVEVVIAALAGSTLDFLGEMTDLIYHSLVLLQAKGLTIENLAAVIASRHKQQNVMQS
jgi:phosphoribosyl-ATP pyrophosphohydrolase/phosphoribosyl-AMP cyclohydrolase